MTNGPVPSENQYWWRSAVIYQVYPRSFADSNGDGVGDLEGIRSRLDYLVELGIDAMWLSPFYLSPQLDGGYDVSDYRAVDPLFGTLADFDALLAGAHERKVRVIIDVVPNHTSSQHAWFQAALASSPGSPERERYIFRPGRGVDGSEPPNNWRSTFGGSAWERVADGEWYLHLFAPSQPDLNWENPEVVEEFHSILRFWLDRGVDGFRIDVANALIKDPTFRDLSAEEVFQQTQGSRKAGHPYWDQIRVHEIYRGWRKVMDEYPGDRATVAEAWVEDAERLSNYLRSDELSTAFNFEYLKARWDATVMRSVIDGTIEALRRVGAPATWVMSNHDVVRHVTRYGGGVLGLRRARAATLLTMALPGGAYVYQGEELGLEEVQDIPDDKIQDPKFFQTNGEVRGRDGCRVPLPWSGSETPFGFGPVGSTPWLPQPASWASITAEVQDDQSLSTLNFYRSALRIRREHPALGDGEMTWLPTENDVLAFSREPGFVCVINFGEEDAPLPETVVSAPTLLTSEHHPSGWIAANSCIWFDLR